MKKISNITFLFCIFTALAFIGCNFKKTNEVISEKSESSETVSVKDNTSEEDDNIVKPLKDYLKKDEINLNWLIGTWEDDSSIIYIRSDGSFRHGFKESEGVNGKWSLLDDGTLYISDCQIYEEDPWIQKYKVKVCMQNRLTLIDENGLVCDLHPFMQKEYKNYLSITSDKIFLVTDGPLNVRKDTSTSSEILAQLQTYEVVEILEIGNKDTISSIKGNWLKIKKGNDEGYIFSGYGSILNGKNYIHSLDDFSKIFPDNWTVDNTKNYLFEDSGEYVVRLDYILTTHQKQFVNLKIYLKLKYMENMDLLIQKYNLEFKKSNPKFGMGNSYNVVIKSEKLQTLSSDNILYFCSDWGSGVSYDILDFLREKTFLEDFEAIQFVYTNLWAKNNKDVYLINNDYIKESRENGNPDSVNYQVITEIMQRLIYIE